MPQITQLPPSMHAMSMRDIATRMGGGVSEEMFAKIDAMLSTL